MRTGLRALWRRFRSGWGMSEAVRTVGHTFILDFQIFIRPRARVRKYVWSGHNSTLGPVITSERKTRGRVILIFWGKKTTMMRSDLEGFNEVSFLWKWCIQTLEITFVNSWSIFFHRQNINSWYFPARRGLIYPSIHWLWPLWLVANQSQDWHIDTDRTSWTSHSHLRTIS